MQMCIPRKGSFIAITEDVISSVGTQKLEFYSKKYPNFHSRQTSFILKRGEWYQVGSIYTVKSSIYINLQLQRSKNTRLWMRNRIKEELIKVSSIYSADDDQAILRSRSLECFGDDLNKRCSVFSHVQEAIQARESITQTSIKNSRRWEQLE